MSRHRNAEWNLEKVNMNVEACSLAVLMDIRQELRDLNRLLRCPNFTNIPQKLERIARNTSKPKRKRATKTNNS